LATRPGVPKVPSRVEHVLSHMLSVGRRDR
jgi:hypothetical protein